MAIKKKERIFYIVESVDDIQGYNFKDLLRVIDENDSCITFDHPALMIANSEGKTLSFNIESSPGTCGFLELIELGSDKLNIKDTTALKEYAKMFDLLFKVLWATDQNFTVYLNTNGTRQTSTYENFLPLCKTMKKIKTYINPNSRNTLQLWVSTNK